ncbi:MAG: 6-phosphogluconolactonase [Elusimicrobiota bacterium]|nr:MAG: 6-phosphogluconolactonase [Elusimicrobiota bacterium]
MLFAAECFVAAAADAIRSSGRFFVALSGGSTPTSLYALLATDRYAPRIDWSRVHAFWGDERCVPPSDPISNYRMAREALLSRVPVRPENVHRIRGESVPTEAASAYERELRQAFRAADDPKAPVARFDLIILGMGEDGHTASLFPGSPGAGEESRWVTARHAAEASMWRVTFTPALINAAAEVLFLVSGRRKAAMLRRVLEGPYLPQELPAQLVAPRAGRLRWLVDAAAAAELTAGGNDL